MHDLTGGLNVTGPGHRERARGDSEPGVEGGGETLPAREAVPGLEVLEHVREVHVGAMREVVVRPDRRIPERLEVGDPLPAGGLLWVEVKPRNSSAPSGIRWAPGTPAASASRLGRLGRREAAAREAATAARDPERAASAKTVSAASPDVVERVAAQEDGDVVLLQDEIVGVAGKRTASSSTATGRPAAVDARRSSGSDRAACRGTKRRK